MSGITGNKYSCIILVYAGRITDRREQYMQESRQQRDRETDRQTGIHAGKKTDIQPAFVLLMCNVVLCNNMNVLINNKKLFHP